MAERDAVSISRAKLPPLTLPVVAWKTWAPFLVVFFSGANLMLIQWVMTREVTTLLLGTELVILLTSVSYFVGVSLGYLLAGRIRRHWLPILGIITLVLHLTLPVTFRVLVAWLGANNLYGLAFLVLPLVTPFIVSLFYSVFLPHFADNGKAGLGPLYLTELLGSIGGVGVLVFLADLGLPTVYLIYTLGLLLILASLGLRRWFVILLGLVGGLWLAIFPTMNQWSNTLWYTALRGFPEGTTVLFSGYSSYQKVDVLQLPEGGRALYLDGLDHFNGAYGIRLNVIVGEVPAELVQPEQALVIGAGVMQTEQLIAAHGGHVTTVELDAMVADVGQRFFYQYNQMDRLTNRTVVVDDAKHFLANTAARYDLIVADTPAALSIQPATLYSVPFYQAIHDHLTPRGIFVGNMTSTFVPGDTISRRVAASALAVFDEVMVITPASVGWSFIIAADDLPFTRETLEAALRRNEEVQFSTFDTAAVRAVVGEAAPITLDSMDLVLQTSLEWINERLHWGEE
ncbi:MAG TPA: fused MFS/spermidine synthase [Phototrophicaceae bacterium]|nr:fused MFS/spermidine synthase [Phototrophicaceae bacterium]